MVAFGILPHSFWRWQEPMNGTLSFYECSLSVGDTMRWWGHSNPTICKKKKFELFALTDDRTQELCLYRSHHCGTFITLNFGIFHSPLV